MMSSDSGVARWIACALGLAGTFYACARSTPSAPTPTPPAAQAPEIRVSFRVYNSALGEIASAASTFSAVYPTGAGLQIVLPISDLQVTGVDPLRAAVYEAHTGTQLAKFVTSTKDGTIRFTAHDTGTYDVFLMSAASGVDYAKADAQMVRTDQPVARYATMRRAPAGEQVLGQTAVDESDAPFRFVAAQFTTALNPFGLQYGRIDFAGSAATADITAAWVYPTPPETCMGARIGPPVFWANPLIVLTNDTSPFLPDPRCWDPRPYVPRVYGGVWVFGAVGSVYLGVQSSCLLVQCPEKIGTFLSGRQPPLTATGMDVARYAALMNGSLK